MDKVAERLINCRIEAGESREELANALGVSVSAISMYENGERIPRDCIKIKIAEHFGTSVQDIFFSENATERDSVLD